MSENNKIIKIRIMADTQDIEGIAEKLIEDSPNMGMKFIEKTKLYSCRPPNENESRIYLTFENTEE